MELLEIPEEPILGEPFVDEPTPVEEFPSVDRLTSFLEMSNVANDIDKDVLKEMGTKVVEDYNLDKKSRAEWEEMLEGAFDLAKQTTKEKYFAGEPVANIKYPALATAAIQFQARALPNIIKGKDVVKGKVIGLATPPELPTDFEAQSDQDAEFENGVIEQQREAFQKWAKADRIGSFMSYQFMDEMDDWQDDVDQLLTSLPIIGCGFKKTYQDGVEGKPRSPYVSAKDLVVNYYAKSLKSASRVTHVIELTPNEIQERIRSDVFLDVDLNDPEPSEEKDSQDDEAAHTFLEQHRWWDVDDDGYKEPYIVTVHKESEQVVRVVSRWDADGVTSNEKGEIVKIEPVHYFTRFLFMPAFDGNFYGMGFGSLMSPMNATINDVINQLLDTGKRASRQGGFIGKGINLGKKAAMYLKTGEWKQVNNTGDDLRKGLVPLPVSEPSSVLFSLLGLMIEATKEVSSVADVLTGEQQGANASPTTTLALIEQGLKVFSSIYKRLHRSFKAEFRKVRRLNRIYLDETHYMTVLDDPEARKSDFDENDIDVVPVSDETELTNTQKLIKAEALNAKKGMGLNDREIDKRYLEALEIPDPEKLLPPEDYEPPPDPEIEIKKVEAETKRIEAENDRERVELEKQHTEAKIRQIDANIERSASTVRKTDAEALTDAHMEKLDALTNVVQSQSKTMAKLADRLLQLVDEREAEIEAREKEKSEGENVSKT